MSAASGDAAQSFSLSLDGSSLIGVGVSIATVDDGVGVAVTDEGDGAFRALFHSATSDSPREYRSNVDEAFELPPPEDGTIAVRTADGGRADKIAPPWIVDRDGAAGQTDYTRGVSQAVIKQVVQDGVKTAGQKGTSVFTQGSGANRIRVMVDNVTGNVITVTKG